MIDAITSNVLPTLSQELAVWGSIGVALCGLAYFWMRMGTTAKQAADSEVKVNVLAQAFSDFREHVAREYASRETIREMEDRLTKAISQAGHIASDAIGRLGERLDRVFEGKA